MHVVLMALFEAIRGHMGSWIKINQTCSGRCRGQNLLFQDPYLSSLTTFMSIVRFLSIVSLSFLPLSIFIANLVIKVHLVLEAGLSYYSFTCFILHRKSKLVKPCHSHSQSSWLQTFEITCSQCKPEWNLVEGYLVVHGIHGKPVRILSRKWSAQEATAAFVKTRSQPAVHCSPDSSTATKHL